MDIQPMDLQGMKIFLLITMMYLCTHPLMAARQVSLQPERVLDMAYDAFDDQYIGCTEVMERESRDILEEEKSAHKGFQRKWKTASKKWNDRKKQLPLPDGFKDENGIALLVYTSGGPENLHKEFNKKVREAGQSLDYYLKHFPFKALHFYLTRALQLLKRDCAEMYQTQVYRGIRPFRYKPVKRGGLVRFGTFASSSLEQEVAESFGTDTFFTIRTCFGVPIADFSYNKKSDEEEVLIPAYEMFRVSNFSSNKTGNKFVLHSSNCTFSCYNCAYIEGKKGPVEPGCQRHRSRQLSP